jgi:hypothetical protein
VRRRIVARLRPRRCSASTLSATGAALGVCGPRRAGIFFNASPAARSHTAVRPAWYSVGPRARAAAPRSGAAFHSSANRCRPAPPGLAVAGGGVAPAVAQVGGHGLLADAESAGDLSHSAAGVEEAQHPRPGGAERAAGAAALFRRHGSPGPSSRQPAPWRPAACGMCRSGRSAPSPRHSRPPSWGRRPTARGEAEWGGAGLGAARGEECERRTPPDRGPRRGRIGTARARCGSRGVADGGVVYSAVISRGN